MMKRCKKMPINPVVSSKETEQFKITKNKVVIFT